MYIYLDRTSKIIIDNVLKSLDLEEKDFVEIIKGDECIKTNDLIELIENLVYKNDYLEEKLEDIKDGKGIQV